MCYIECTKNKRYVLSIYVCQSSSKSNLWISITIALIFTEFKKKVHAWGLMQGAVIILGDLERVSPLQFCSLHNHNLTEKLFGTVMLTFSNFQL
jgi:hypothetical protein